MTKRTIIFRADGGASIGMGHFIRTLALAEMLHEHFHCIYATRQPSEYQIREIKKICHSRIDLPEDDSHFEQFLTHLKGNEIVVLDNYYFTTDYQKAIKSKGCKLVCIDDIHDKHYVADVVINHAPGLNEKDFSRENNTNLLLGPKYSLVKRVYRVNNSNRIEISEYPKSLLIVFGGADFYNLTQSYIEEVIGLNIFEKISIITGNGYKFLNELNSYLSRNTKENLCHFHNITAEEIVVVAEDSDLAIAPASTILFELLTLNKPVISGYYVDNQKEIYKGFTELDIIFKMDDLNHVSRLKNVLSGLNSYAINRVTSRLSDVFDNQVDIRFKSVFLSL
jgi:UDP-2,4-diacetamido-2,4,6-trideoxy-beta-L-altropyranose hydrolase